MLFHCFSVAQSCQTLRPHEQQHARGCPSLSPTACSNLCPRSQWCHPKISSCHPLLLLPSIFPSIKVFPMSQLFVSGGQSIGASASASVLPMNIQGWFSLGLTGFISSQSKSTSRVFSSTTIQNHQFFGTQLSLWSNSHICTRLLEKPYSFGYTDLCQQWCLCFLIHCLDLS